MKHALEIVGMVWGVRLFLNLYKYSLTGRTDVSSQSLDLLGNRNTSPG